MIVIFIWIQRHLSSHLVSEDGLKARPSDDCLSSLIEGWTISLFCDIVSLIRRGTKRKVNETVDTVAGECGLDIGDLWADTSETNGISIFSLLNYTKQKSYVHVSETKHSRQLTSQES